MEAEGQKKLYIDGLNLSEQFGLSKRAWSIQVPKREIERFVVALRNTGWEPTVFIDAGIESGEALKKWRTRREEEVLHCFRNVPACHSNLMGDLFRLHGVRVWYSPHDADSDDCLATFAQLDGASVLSNDLDFARYRGKTYNQYGDFRYDGDRVLLVPKKIDERKVPSPRDFLPKKPQMVERDPGFVSIRELGLYRRGCPTFATKFCGNLHSYLHPLRVALYAKWKLKSVKEEWPCFENGKVEWQTSHYHDGDTKTVEVPEKYDREAAFELARFIERNEECPSVCRNCKYQQRCERLHAFSLLLQSGATIVRFLSASRTE
jgi:hypothetical protein